MRSAIPAPNLSGSRGSQPFRLRGAVLPALVLVIVLALAGTATATSLFYIRGGGDGHGIGLSQYGAYGYALHGKGYRWILAHYYRGTGLGRVDPGRTVRVLLASGPAAFAGARRADGKALRPAETYDVRPNADGTITLLNQAGKPTGTFKAPLRVTGRAPLSVAGIGQYRGALEFRPNGAGGVETVNALALDDYVRGVISAEMPASWSTEALRAQAVAARTYAITSNVGGRSFDLYPDTRSQMYRGVAAETPTTDAAVAATPGQVVTYRGAPVVTYFFNSSGGHTESVENVWPGATPRPWLRGVPDRYDSAGSDPYHRWGYDLTTAGAAARLGGFMKGSLVGIRVLKTGVSPRVITAEVVGTRGRTRVSGAQLQHAFGLLTTDAAFTTIGSTPGAQPVRGTRATPHAELPHGAAQAQAVAALVPLVQQLVARAVPGLHGTVFPGARGAPLEVQVNHGGRWDTVSRTYTDAGGAFSVRLPGPGSYRVSYRGLSGPVVNVS